MDQKAPGDLATHPPTLDPADIHPSRLLMVAEPADGAPAMVLVEGRWEESEE